MVTKAHAVALSILEEHNQLAKEIHVKAEHVWYEFPTIRLQ
jgi:hypothetical protein